MFDSPAARRLPQANVDPFRSQYDALSLITLMMNPDAFETWVITLDTEHRGRSILHVPGTDEFDAVLGVVEMSAEAVAHEPDIGGLIVASVRPFGGPQLSDIDRWHEADDVCVDYGLELVEWFVLGQSITCPRDFTDVAPRWAA